MTISKTFFFVPFGSNKLECYKYISLERTAKDYLIRTVSKLLKKKMCSIDTLSVKLSTEK
jgi:hypothetical protein